MEAVIVNEYHPYEDLTRSWIIYSSSKQEVSKIQREIDKILSLYSFYPEIEWSRYGYKPPENFQVLGAWRNPNPQKKVFAFLLDNPRMLSVEPTYQLLFHVVGAIDEIKIIEPKVETLKQRYDLQTKKENSDTSVNDRLNQLGESKSLTVFSTIMVVFTAIINGFSLYLRELPPPELTNQSLVNTYKTFLAIVNFSALTLLMLVIFLAAIFAIKYGVLLIRKL